MSEHRRQGDDPGSPQDTDAVPGGDAQPSADDPPSREPTECAVVGIGASAGGLDAFEALFAALPVDTGLAFVVLSHLEPTHPSALSDILARATPMPVTDAVDREPLAPNHVFVLPAGQDMTSDGGRLHLQPRGAEALHRPIDLFLRSLAQDRGHQAIGVILSGTGTDGTLGIRAIKGASGLTFAQDDSARYPSMPQSAIADGHVDFVLPPHAIAEELIRIGRLPDGLRTRTQTLGDDDAGFGQILEAVRRHTGVDFAQYKENTLRRRILRRMILHRIEEPRAYADVLRAAPDEAQALHDDLLIGVTSFFRDPDAFEALARTAFPKLVSTERLRDPLRVWVLGCSTGEEAYSLAIALTEFMDATGAHRPLQIFASDVNAAGIRAARAGLYPGAIAQDVSPARLQRFFVDVDGRWRVVKALRDACIFSRHNVLTDPPFSRIDLVSCRNLLMYLQPGLQQDVIRSLHYALVPSGALWLGAADTIGAHQALFDVLDAGHKLFARRPGTLSHPALRSAVTRVRAADPSAPAPARTASDLLKDSDRLLLARFAPAAVLVSPDMEVLQYRGNVGPYIAPAPGKASHHLMQVLERRLQVMVRSAIARAEQERAIVREEVVSLPAAAGEERSVTVEVVPLGSPARGYLLLFDADRHADPSVRQHPRRGRHEQPSDVATRLSKELADTQAYLQTVIQRQEAAHEDLEIAHEQAQSANEELQSINEELETSKEEIQSANEELTTLNDELRHRNTELQRTNNDLQNLLTSTDVAVVFVGPELTIRRFTPAAAGLLGLRAADVGRALRELRLPIDVRLDDAIRQTLATLAPHEQDVRDGHDRWFSVRVRPYRTSDNHVDGAVVVFVDIDVSARARRYAESIIATVRTPLVVLDESLTIVTANEAFCGAFRLESPAVEGRALFEVADSLRDPHLGRLLDQVLPLNQVVRDLPISVPVDGSPRAWMVNARRLMQPESATPLMLLSMEDVSDQVQAEALRRQRVDDMAAADQSKNEFLAMLAHELRNPLAPIRTAAALLGTPGVPAAAADHSRSVIERQIHHMVRLIDDLLNVARITQGKLELQLAPADLTRVLRRAIELVQPVINERAQHVALSAPQDAIYVLGDVARLEQAFGNLLHNASKFTAAGGHVWVRVDSRPTAHGADGLVSVRDDGVGIAAPMLPHVFELFRQVGDSPHRASGLGVGLALVRRIVELHGGTVAASSAGLDRGSEFVVCLPLLQSAVQTADLDPMPSEPVAEGLRVLIVDDNADAADTLGTLLRILGHETRTVHDGVAALAIAAQFLPDVAFLDIAMPTMNGYDVARQLRRIPGMEAAMLIAVTGFGRDLDRQRAFDAGFDRHVTKPLDPADLSALTARRPPTEPE